MLFTYSEGIYSLTFRAKRVKQTNSKRDKNFKRVTNIQNIHSFSKSNFADEDLK